MSKTMRPQRVTCKDGFCDHQYTNDEGRVRVVIGTLIYARVKFDGACVILDGEMHQQFPMSHIETTLKRDELLRSEFQALIDNEASVSELVNFFESLDRFVDNDVDFDE